MVYQYRAEWLGITGSPGVSVFNARLSGAALDTGPQQFADNVRVFFDGLKGYLGAGTSISFSAEVVEMDTVTGVLTAVHPVSAPATVTSIDGGKFAAPAGVRVDWLTESITAGRRLRGRTFIVPVTSTIYEANGTIDATARDNILAAASGLISGMENIGSLSVWSRTHGVLADVQAASVPDEVAVLRSRRD